MSPKRANSHHYSEVDLQPYGTETSQRPHQIAMRSPQKGLLKTEAIYHIAATQEAREPAQATFLEAAKTLGGPTDTWKLQEIGGPKSPIAKAFAAG